MSIILKEAPVDQNNRTAKERADETQNEIKRRRLIPEKAHAYDKLLGSSLSVFITTRERIS